MKNASLEMPRGGERWGLVGAERLPLLHAVCVLQRRGARAGSGRKGCVCVLPCLPSCTAHASHVSATWLSHGLSMAFHCHQGRCHDCFYPFLTECNCTENGVCNGGLHGDGVCFCAEGWTGDRCEVRLGEGCQAPPPAVLCDSVACGCFPSSWIVQAASQKYLQKGALSCRGSS